MKSAKARDSRRRSRAKFNLLSTGATRLGGPPFSDPSLFDPFESVMVRFKEFCQILLLLLQCRLISDEDYIILYELFSSRNPDIAYENNRFESNERR